VEAALVKLGVDPAELKQLGLVTETFARAKRGMPAVIQAMRLSANRVVPFEAYAIAAGRGSAAIGGGDDLCDAGAVGG